MDAANLALLAQELGHDEGEVHYAYQDKEGFWTIGIGRLIDKRKGGGISHAEALYLFGNDVAEKMADLDAHLPWWKTLSPARQRVLVNVCFNLGIDGLLAFHNTLAAIQRGDYEAAAQGLLDSKAHRQTGIRYEHLAELMRQG